jgi:hypothetical protein
VPTLRDRIEETKTKFSDLFASIRSKQTESNLESNVEQPVASSSKIKLEDLSNNQEVVQPNSDGSDNSFDRYFPHAFPGDPENPNSLLESSNKIENKEELPKIIVSESSEQTLAQVEETVQENSGSQHPKTGFFNLFKDINKLRDNGSKVLKSVSREQTIDTGGVTENIKTDNPIEIEGKTIPIIKHDEVVSHNNPSVSNLFDDTMALFDDEPDNNQEDHNISQDSKSTELIDS